MLKKNIYNLLFTVFTAMILFSCSDEESVSVVPQQPEIPLCNIIQPIECDSTKAYAKGYELDILVSAVDQDGQIKKVEFMVDDVVLDSLELDSLNLNRYYLPQKWDTAEKDSGVYILKAVAYDNDNSAATDSILLHLVTVAKPSGLDTAYIKNTNTVNLSWDQIGSKLAKNNYLAYKEFKLYRKDADTLVSYNTVEESLVDTIVPSGLHKYYLTALYENPQVESLPTDTIDIFTNIKPLCTFDPELQEVGVTYPLNDNLIINVDSEDEDVNGKIDSVRLYINNIYKTTSQEEYATFTITPQMTGIRGFHTIKAVVYDNEGETEEISRTLHFKNLPVPTNLKILEEGNNLILSWAENKDVSSYRIYRNGIIIADDVTGSKYNDNKVSSGEYSYSVRAIYDESYTGYGLGVSAASVAVSATIQDNYPPFCKFVFPTANSGLAAGEEIDIIVNAFDYDGTLKHVVLSEGDTVLKDTLLQTDALNNIYSLSKWTMPDEDEVTITVEATDNFNLTSSETISLSRGNYHSPTELEAMGTVLGNSVALNWDKPEASNPKGYYLYRMTEDEETVVSNLILTPAYTDQNLTSGTYQYFVRSVYAPQSGDEDILSPFSNIITVIVDNSPECTVTSPADSSGFKIGSTVEIAVEAEDNSSVESVKYYINNELQVTIEESPYIYQWDTAEQNEGEYVIKVIAKDDSGQETSQTVTVYLAVFNPPINLTSLEQIIGNTASLNWEKPEDSKFVRAKNDLVAYNLYKKDTLTTEFVKIAADIEFANTSYVDNTVQFGDSRYYVTALYNYPKAFKNNIKGASIESEPSNIALIYSNYLPECKIISPVEDLEYIIRDSILIATASTVEGGVIERVDFFIDGIEKGAVTEYPYSFYWDTRGEMEGEHEIITLATDNNGLTAADTISIKLVTNIEKRYHSGLSGKSGWIFEKNTKGYGVVFDCSAQKNSLLKTFSFYHPPCEDNSKFNILIVDWLNKEVLETIENLTTSIPVGWEENIELNDYDISGTSGKIGIFVQPLTFGGYDDSNNLEYYQPEVMFDSLKVAASSNSYIVDIADMEVNENLHVAANDSIYSPEYMINLYIYEKDK